MQPAAWRAWGATVREEAAAAFEQALTLDHNSYQAHDSTPDSRQ